MEATNSTNAAPNAGRKISNANERAVVIATESTAELRDLASYTRDIRLAAKYLDHYLAGEIEGDRDYASPLDAMWTTAVIMYARAFARGVRSAKGPDVVGLSTDEMRTHAYVLDVRNKYLAHSVNGFEHVEVVAFLTDSSLSQKAITGIGDVHTSLNRMGRHSAADFRALCGRHLDALQSRTAKLHTTIIDELQTMGSAAVYALPDHVSPAIDQSASRSRRK